MTMSATVLELPVATKLKTPRGISPLILMLLSPVLFLAGLADLSRVSLCTTNIIPGALQSAFTLLVMTALVVSGSVVAVRYTLAKWLRNGQLAAAPSVEVMRIQDRKPEAYVDGKNGMFTGSGK